MQNDCTAVLPPLTSHGALSLYPLWDIWFNGMVCRIPILLESPKSMNILCISRSSSCNASFLFAQGCLCMYCEHYISVIRSLSPCVWHGGRPDVEFDILCMLYKILKHVCICIYVACVYIFIGHVSFSSHKYKCNHHPHHMAIWRLFY